MANLLSGIFATQDSLTNESNSDHHKMNMQLSNVVSDAVGESGLRIIEAIITRERNPEQLAALCSNRIKASRQTVAKFTR